MYRIIVIVAAFVVVTCIAAFLMGPHILIWGHAAAQMSTVYQLTGVYTSTWVIASLQGVLAAALAGLFTERW